MNAIQKAVELLGGQALTAKRIGVSKQSVFAWVHGIKSVPGVRAIQIERATNGEVKVDDLITIPPINKKSA